MPGYSWIIILLNQDKAKQTLQNSIKLIGNRIQSCGNHRWSGSNLFLQDERTALAPRKHNIDLTEGFI